MNSSKHTPAPVMPGITPYCQSKLETIHAINGTSIIWPAAHEAAKIPSTRPRFSTNQRVATVAANPKLSMPLARPNNVPIEKNRCHFSSANVVNPRPAMRDTQEITTIFVNPRCNIKAVPNGAATATIINKAPIIAEISVIDHPKAFIIGNIKTAGVLAAEEENIRRKNEINAINQA